jgi:hypothetical protein
MNHYTPQMRKFIGTLLLSALCISAHAQKMPGVEPYGKVDQADLELKDCDFEKGANAMVLFDYANMDEKAGMPVGRHLRIKVFNDFGKSLGNIVLEFRTYKYDVDGDVGITDLKAETINLENGKAVVTPLDKSQVYRVAVDKWHFAVKFAMPNVKAGSVIDISYRQFIPSEWRFQNIIPVRYSEIDLNIPQAINARGMDGRIVPWVVNFKSIPHVKQPYVKSVGETSSGTQIRAMANVHSLPQEPFMASRVDNFQRIEFLGVDTYVSTWPKIGDFLLRASDFGQDMDRSLSGESEIVKKAKSLKSQEEKIACVFDSVKTRMKWNGINVCYSIDGTSKAWGKQTGNSAEINMMVYHLLKKAGVKSYPLVVSTKSNGKINPANASVFQFNHMVVYIPVDSTKMYVLDASRKENLYNTIPANILNTFGLSIDPRNNLSIDQSEKDKAFQMVFISDEEPAMQSVSLSGDIKPDGKIEGNAEITSFKYNKERALRLYDTVGEAKYIDSLRKGDNNLKIASFKMENADVDSLPLSQKVSFSMDLPGSDGNYIYFNGNLFNSMGKNPFFKDERFSDIDFGYLDNYAVYGVYKMPDGYKSEALPKSISVMMPDQSMVFKRTVAEDGGTILVKYVLSHRKTIYFREDYPDIQGFYKKMYELLNEQIVLKKS